MKVAIFTDAYTPDINGVATSVSILYHELVNHGHQALIVTTTMPKGSDYVDNENVLRIHGRTLKRLYGYRMAGFYNSRALETIRKFNPDLIHTQTEFGIGLFGRIVAEVLHRPVVYTYHTMWADYSHYATKGLQPLDMLIKYWLKKLSRIYSNHTTQVIVPSQKAADVLYEYGVHKRIHVIPTGLDLERFGQSHVSKKQVAAIRKQYHLDDYFTIVFVGRVAEEKSIDFLIHAMKKIIPVKRNARLFIVGGGPELDKLKSYTIKEGLADYVIFAGPQIPQDVPAYYRAGDIFACASMTETQGLTYIEAMASGLPVFARYDKNLDGVIHNGENGLFFKTENEYVRQIIDLKPAEAKRIGEQAEKDAKKYSSEDFYNKVMGVYMEALDQFAHYQITELEKEGHLTEVTLTNPKQTFHFKLANKTVEEYGLQRGKIIDQETFNILFDLDGMRRCYNDALKALSYHDYPEAKLAAKLDKKHVYTKDQIRMTLTLLSDKHLIDDFDYAHNYTAQCLKKGYGFNKAKTDLAKLGIKQHIIDEVLSEFDDDQAYEQALTLVHKLSLANTNRSQKALINSIKEKLFRRGFSQDVIERVIDDAGISVSKEKSIAMMSKQYERFYKRYGSKFQGRQLYNKIKAALINKGYDYEDVNELMEEQWSEDDD